MHRVKACIKNSSAMTLVEILVSIVILGLVLMAVFPMLTQSLKVTNLANRITAQLFADQEDIEIVAATNGGVLFADGTFLTDKQFEVLFDEDYSKTVVGMTIKKGKLIRFLASISRIKATYVYEGYNESEAVIPITGVRTSFIADSTECLVMDCDGHDVTSDCDFICGSDLTADEDLQATSAQLTLPTASNRFTNLQAPYTITLTTGNEQVSTLLPVYLPRGVAVESSNNLRISSNTEDWILKNTSSTINHTINKITYMDLETSDQDDGFVAVGSSGSIYAWLDGHALQLINHNLTTRNLNSVMYCNDKKMLVACGDDGVILISSDGISWSKPSSHTNQDLHSISYLSNAERFVCVGEAGIILSSADGANWSRQHSYPRLAAGEINGYDAVEFSGNGDYLQTVYAPVNGDTARTVIMLARPETTNDTLISWGTPVNTVAGGRYTLRIDSDGCLGVEQDDDTAFTSSLTPLLNGTPSILISHSSSASATETSHHLYLNGAIPQSSTITGVLNTAIYADDGDEDDDFIYFPAQLGSDPLTRYTGPLAYKGMMAEVMVFNTAVNIDRPDLGDDNYEASDMDLIIKYLSDKYELEIAGINGINLNNLYDPDTDTPLSELTLDSFPQTGLVLWLDANNTKSLDLEDEEQVLVWQDLVEADDDHVSNPASGADLLSVACSFGQIIAGGRHRNLLSSDNSSNWSQSSQLDDKSTVEYNLSKMVCTNDSKFVALLNDGLSSFDRDDPAARQNGYIAYSDNGSDWTYEELSASGYYMNDIFYGIDCGVLLAVGNHGSMFTSADNGANWNPINLGTVNNLLAGCVR